MAGRDHVNRTGFIVSTEGDESFPASSYLQVKKLGSLPIHQKLTRRARNPVDKLRALCRVILGITGQSKHVGFLLVFE